MNRPLYTISVLAAALFAAAACQSGITPDEEPGDGIVCFQPELGGLRHAELDSASQTKAAELVSADGSITVPLTVEVVDGIAGQARNDAAPQTKGAQKNTGSGFDALANYGITSFQVKAWKGTNPFISAYETVTKSANPHIWNTTGTYQWAAGTNLTFYAYANKPTSGAVIENASSAAQTLTYTAPTTAEAQQDILMGYYSGTPRFDTESHTGGVADIKFYHPLTAVVFKLGKFEGDPTVTVKKISLKGVYGSGTASTSTTPADNDPGKRFTWTPSGSTTVTLGNGTSDLSIDSDTKVIGEPFLLIPQDLSAKRATVTVELVVNGTPKTLEAKIGTGEWEAGKTYTYSLTVLPPHEFKLTTASDASYTFTNPSTTSNKTIQIISTVNDVDSDWTLKSVNGIAVSGTSYSISNTIQIVKYGNNLFVIDTRPKVNHGDHGFWTTSGTDWYRAPLSGTIDLSKYDFQTGSATDMNTANCYIVRNSGTYRIPLVYGNAIVDNNTNSSAYSGTTGTNALGPFVNHLGNGIFDPFIENNRNDVGGTSFDAGKRLVASSAEVIWQDVDGVIGSTVTVTSHSAGTAKCDDSNCGYLTFTVNETNICQSNAVIAVKDADGNVLWSWHIWVTNDPALSGPSIPVTNYAGNTSNFFPVPAIGWKDPDLYEGRGDTTILLEQDDTGETLTVRIKQPEYRYEDGTSLLYQFGRKDPMRYGISSDINTGTTDLKTSILNPASFYTAWNAGDKYNLWTGKESNRYSLSTLLGSNSDAEEGTNMIKTIYDPSPVGYKVPSVKAFTGFTKEGKKCGGENGVYPLSDSNVSAIYHKGWDFYTNSSKSSTIYFPAVYYRNNTGASSSFAMGRYFTSTVNSDSTNGSFEFQFQSTYVYPITEKSSRANALSIRPITDK